MKLKSLSLNEFESEVIPSACLVAMLRKLADEQGKPVTIIEAKPEGRTMKVIGKGLLVCGGLYFAIHVLIWAVK